MSGILESTLAPSTRQPGATRVNRASLQVETFIHEWNRGFPNVEAAQAQLDRDMPELVREATDHPHGYAHRQLNHLIEVLAEAKALQANEPEKYADVFPLRISASVKSANSVGDEEAAFRFIDWLIREWAPTWLRGHGAGVDGMGDMLEHVKFGLLGLDPIVDHATLLDAVQPILDIRDLLEDFDDPIPSDVIEAIDRSGYNAAYRGADEIDVCLADALTHEALTVLRTCVGVVVTEGNQRIFGTITAKLHASAVAMLAELADVAPAATGAAS